MSKGNMGFITKTIHGGIRIDDPHNALATPIYQTSTYIFDTAEQGARRFALEEEGFIYSRFGNPTTAVLESRVAALENAEAAVSFSSGMAAITTVIYSICKAGDHILADKTLYACTFTYLVHGLTNFGIEVSIVDFANLEEVKASLKENTSLVYFETPANPTMKIIDIQAISDITHNFNKDIKVMIDNTFATPYLQRPLDLGCDVSVHSATKYLNGHGDVIAGIACGTEEFMAHVRFFGLKDMTGAAQSAMDSFLVLRGLKTLTLRVDRHCEIATKLVEYLQTKPQVEKIYYPGLETHPNHEIAKKQMAQFGGLIGFELKGGLESGKTFLNNLGLCKLTVSLGDAETLIQHPASMTHAIYTPAERRAAGISEGLIRLSAGLEDIEDIIEDLERGFFSIG